MLEATNLTCVRGDRALFRQLTFSLRPGELLHVTGANGSGKTTLLRALCGLGYIDAGEIRWRGSKIRRLGDDYRKDLIYLGHQNGIQGELTPVENLRNATSLAGTDGDATDAAIDRVGLAAYRHFPAKILSQGQQRRLALARLLAVPRLLWILDEPYNTLDTASVQTVNDLLAAHLAGGGLVVLTSHQDLSEGFRCVQLRLDA